MEELIKFANEKIKEHCPEYNLRLNNAKTALGMCNYTQRTILLSKHFIKHSPIEVMKNTVLHEIAHALAPGAGHGREWKRMCLKVGAKPVRCNSEAVSVGHKWAIVCLDCNKELGRFHRKPKTQSRTTRKLCGLCRSRDLAVRSIMT